MCVSKHSVICRSGGIISIIVMLILGTACTSMPESIQYDNPQQVSLQAVQQSTADHRGQMVRWGGVITQVINNETETWIEVLALSLNDSGRPSSDRKNNQGRFIAKVAQFLDPEVYQEGKSFTVVGLLTDKIDGKIGDYKYSFPVVAVQGHHLWSNIVYRQHPLITPGYWYYGFHPYWQFGYSYYGYGVRHHLGYYPYYPFFGHLQRYSSLPPIHSSHENFRPFNDRNWPLNLNNAVVSWNQIRANHFRSNGVTRNFNTAQINNRRHSYTTRSNNTSSRFVKASRRTMSRSSDISNASKPRNSNQN